MQNPENHCYTPSSISFITRSIILTALLLLSLIGIGHAEAIEEKESITARTVDTESVASWAKGRLLVLPRAGLPEQESDNAFKPHGGIKAKHRLEKLNVLIYDLPDGVDEVKVLNKLKKDRRFKDIELDMLVAADQTVTDPTFSSSWALPKIGAPTAWDISNADGITIAILDTGVDSNHPDLAANIVPGWNVYNNNADTTDVHGHGTKTAGVAAASANNGIGSAGVAWSASIMPIRIADANAYAYFSTMASGIRWAADNGAKIANISYSGAAGSLTVQSAANYMRSKGGIVVVSAGNTGGYLNYAASDSLLAIAATSSSDVRASWSSYGPFVDFAAPGVSIYTTTRGGSYGYVSGTSFSSPIVAATAALMLSANSNLTPTDVDQILKSTAIDLGTTSYDQYYGYGRIDAAKAVKTAWTKISVDSQAPIISITSPTGGQEVSGIVAVDVNYSDNQGVVRVDLYVNGQKIITDSQAPYSFAWDTTKLADGTYNLTGRAYDAAGNEGISTSVLVTVKNAVLSASQDSPSKPVITSFNLTDGMKTSHKQKVSATADDDQAITRISLLINGSEVAVSHNNSLNYTWDTWRSAPRGSWLSVTVEAADSDGNKTSQTVNVQN